jgi:hypothetical protein
VAVGLVVDDEAEVVGDVHVSVPGGLGSGRHDDGLMADRTGDGERAIADGYTAFLGLAAGG